MSEFDNLPRSSFLGTEFAAESWRVRGGVRDHVHEFPHAPGGSTEKLGRKLYEFTFEAIFDQRLIGYTDLFTVVLPKLRRSFEEEVTGPLVVPTLGTVQAMATSWDEHAEPKRQRSGVKVSLTFREDQSQLYVISQIVAASASTVLAKSATYAATAAEFPNSAPLTAVTVQAGIVADIAASTDPTAASVAIEAAHLAELCSIADRTAPEVDQAKNWPLLYALADLHEAAVKLRADALRKSEPLIVWQTPRRMSITHVSVILYGTTDRAVELMMLNALDDPTDIPPGVDLVVYEPTLELAA